MITRGSGGHQKRTRVDRHQGPGRGQQQPPTQVRSHLLVRHHGQRHTPPPDRGGHRTKHRQRLTQPATTGHATVRLDRPDPGIQHPQDTHQHPAPPLGPFTAQPAQPPAHSGGRNATANDHGANTPPQGQRSTPAASRRSTPAASPPTVTKTVPPSTQTALLKLAKRTRRAVAQTDGAHNGGGHQPTPTRHTDQRACPTSTTPTGPSRDTVNGGGHRNSWNALAASESSARVGPDSVPSIEPARRVSG